MGVSWQNHIWNLVAVLAQAPFSPQLVLCLSLSLMSQMSLMSEKTQPANDADAQHRGSRSGHPVPDDAPPMSLRQVMRDTIAAGLRAPDQHYSAEGSTAKPDVPCAMPVLRPHAHQAMMLMPSQTRALYVNAQSYVRAPDLADRASPKPGANEEYKRYKNGFEAKQYLYKTFDFASTAIPNCIRSLSVEEYQNSSE